MKHLIFILSVLFMTIVAGLLYKYIGFEPTVIALLVIIWAYSATGETKK